MKIFYSDHYTVPLPEGHRFPMEKYRLLREKLLTDGILEPGELYEPELPAREIIIPVVGVFTNNKQYFK